MPFDFLFTIFLSYILYILVSAPFGNLINLLLMPVKLSSLQDDRTNNKPEENLKINKQAIKGLKVVKRVLSKVINLMILK